MKQLVSESLKQFMLHEENKLKGGKGDDTSKKEVNQHQLAIGRLVEKEHTNISKTAEEIALDHLAENENYYTDLVEKGMVDELPAVKKYVEHFGESKLPEKYKKMLKEKE